MRIFPDKNFRKIYKENYDKSYNKIMSYRTEFARKIEISRREKPIMKIQRIVGLFSTVLIFGTIFSVGYAMNSVFVEKEQQIAELQYNSEELDKMIQEYQIINAEEKYVQIDDAVRIVADLQNQYVKNEYADDFEAYASVYLGDFNENWAIGITELENPVWQGYLDKSCDFRTKADMLFVFYNAAKPVLVVESSFDIDAYGNLGKMIRADVEKLI